MLNQFSRTQLLYGKEAMDKLKKSRVAVFGVGGVGGYVVEALARSGVGSFDIIDDDKVCMTNINRQIIATFDTVGKYKVDVLKDRILAINPQAKVETYKCFFLPENKMILTLQSMIMLLMLLIPFQLKIALVLKAQKSKTPIISCMGSGNKLDPQAFEVADIYKTSVDPLARVMRYELKKRRVRKLKVVYSKEYPTRPLEDMSISCRTHCVCPAGTRKCTVRRDIPGSNAFVPASAGLLIASEVLKDLTKK